MNLHGFTFQSNEVLKGFMQEIDQEIRTVLIKFNAHSEIKENDKL